MYYLFYKSLVALQEFFFCLFRLIFLFGKCETSLCVLVVSSGFFIETFCSVSLLLLTLTLPEASEVLN